MSKNSGEGEQGEALLPCPFCGAMPETCDGPHESILVNCGTRMCAGGIGWAMRVEWNKRAPSSTVAGAQEKTLEDAVKLHVPQLIERLERIGSEGYENHAGFLCNYIDFLECLGVLRSLLAPSPAVAGAQEKEARLKRALKAIWDFSANATPSVDLLNSISETCCRALSDAEKTWEKKEADVNAGDATRQKERE